MIIVMADLAEHKCTMCTYSTCRAYNLKRHMIQHQPKPSGFQCPDCGKQYSRKHTLKEHQQLSCGKDKGLRCEICNKEFNHRSSRAFHIEKCKRTEAVATPAVTNITNITNNIQNNITVLVYPKDGASDIGFDFITSHITDSVMKACINSGKPSIGFNRFMGEVMNNPANRIAHKTNPNTKYSKIHVGNGCWNYELDTEVFPTMTHHMSTAALQKTDEVKGRLRVNAQNFIGYIDEVNADDESSSYADALERIKLMLVNLCQTIGKD